MGAGMLGASAARHLSLDPAAGAVTVIGPDEPRHGTSHECGVPFGAWHDEARLTRVVADDDVWATLARESIDRYGQIAAEGGQPFHRTQGVIHVHEAPVGFERQLAVARRHLAHFVVRSPEEYPYLRMKAGTQIIAEFGGAGTVNPRVLVQNQLAAAASRGATVVRDYVVGLDVAIDGVQVRTSDGNTLSADRVVVAAGAYVQAFGLLPEPLPVQSVGITALFFRVGGVAAEVLARMPGILWNGDGGHHCLYSVPPTRYPDGNLWFKVGSFRHSCPMQTSDEIDEWHRRDGSTSEAAFLRTWVDEHIPVLSGSDGHAIGCTITESASTFPIIREVAPRVVVATGCGGAAAKSSDEIGRIAAKLVTQGRWDSTLDQTHFGG